MISHGGAKSIVIYYNISCILFVIACMEHILLELLLRKY